MKVPPPTFCPDCRRIKRLTFRNERSFSNRTCFSCGKNVISIYKSDEFKVLCQDCYLSDKFEALSYGVDLSFKESLFSQIYELLKSVPHIHLNTHISNINSPYVNYIVQSKNCYLCFGGGYIENVMFSNLAVDTKDSLEMYFSSNCDSCYELSNSQKCYRVFWGKNLKDCFDSYFLEDSAGCSDCIMSVNLRNKSFYFKNKQYTKEEYQKLKNDFIKEIHLGNLKKVIKEYKEDVLLKSPQKYANILNSINGTGDNISESVNIKNSFNIKKVENCLNSQEIINNVKDVSDSTSIGLNSSMIYECLTASINVSNIQFSCIIRNNSFNVFYSYSMTSCQNCFACIGLKNKQYCILNRQYTKEEYEELVPKIIKHMNDMPYIDSMGRIYKYGEFFPSELSPFAYNETTAQEYYPLTKEEAIQQGYRWKDKEERNYSIDIKTEDIPDDINDTDESIINKVIECAHKDCNHQCTEAFKIIEPEYQFYKRMNLPIPHLCPNCRHYERLSQRNPLKLWHRTCMKEGCTNTFETSYAPERSEIVYCEECYKREVY
jgi:hypothetical protein